MRKINYPKVGDTLILKNRGLLKVEKKAKIIKSGNWYALLDIRKNALISLRDEFLGHIGESYLISSISDLLERLTKDYQVYVAD